MHFRPTSTPFASMTEHAKALLPKSRIRLFSKTEHFPSSNRVIELKTGVERRPPLSPLSAPHLQGGSPTLMPHTLGFLRRAKNRRAIRTRPRRQLVSCRVNLRMLQCLTYCLSVSTVQAKPGAVFRLLCRAMLRPLGVGKSVGAL